MPIDDAKLEEARIIGYNEALEDLADKDEVSLASYKAKLLLKGKTKSSKSEWWDKNSSALIAVIGTIIVAFFGFYNTNKQIDQKDAEIKQKTAEIEQKNKEIQITNAKTLGGLVEKLSSENPLVKRYAAFAAISLDIKDFDKYVISSLKSPDDAETLEILLERKKEQVDFYEANNKAPEQDDNLKKQKAELQNLKRQLAELYAQLSEKKRTEASNNINNQTTLLSESKQFADKSLSNDESNIRATYQLGAIVRDTDTAEAIKRFEKVIELLKDKSERNNNELFQKANLNLTWLYKKLSDSSKIQSEKDKNLNKAKCYSAQTIEIFEIIRQYEYLFGKDKGKLNEENFVNASNSVNPNKSNVHSNCLDIK